DGFEKQYVNYLQQNDHLYQTAVDDSNSSYSQAIWILLSVLILVLVVIVAVWGGIRHALIVPLNRLTDSIRHIASGDLVKRIEVEGSNEMGQLADTLR
ncbi:HAMP domain-containing protein, partial [Leclercia adecarboxylata]